MTDGKKMVVEIDGRNFEYKAPYLDKIKKLGTFLPPIDEKTAFEPFHGTALNVDYAAIMSDVPGKLVPILKFIFSNEDDVTEDIAKGLDEADVFAVINGFFSLAQVRTVKFKDGAEHLNAIADETWETYRRMVSYSISASSKLLEEIPPQSIGSGETTL